MICPYFARVHRDHILAGVRAHQSACNMAEVDETIQTFTGLRLRLIYCEEHLEMQQQREQLLFNVLGFPAADAESRFD